LNLIGGSSFSDFCALPSATGIRMHLRVAIRTLPGHPPPPFRVPEDRRSLQSAGYQADDLWSLSVTNACSDAIRRPGQHCARPRREHWAIALEIVEREEDAQCVG
jgi:hypothetical protein